MLLGRIAAAMKVTGSCDRHLTSLMTSLSLSISRWWRQTWDTRLYLTVVSQSEASQHRAWDKCGSPREVNVTVTTLVSSIINKYHIQLLRYHEINTIDCDIHMHYTRLPSDDGQQAMFTSLLIGPCIFPIHDIRYFDTTATILVVEYITFIRYRTCWLRTS